MLVVAGSADAGREEGTQMNKFRLDVMFMDCPAYLDKHGTARCGLPAAVEYRYTISSMEGLLESARIRCPRGHWFNGPVEALTWEKPQGTGTASHQGHRRTARA
jgi:hypothetical protein